MRSGPAFCFGLFYIDREAAAHLGGYLFVSEQLFAEPAHLEGYFFVSEQLFVVPAHLGRYFFVSEQLLNTLHRVL